MDKKLNCTFDGGIYNIDITNDYVSLKAEYVEEFLTKYTFTVSDLALWLVLLLCGLVVILTGIIGYVLCICRTKAKDQTRNAQLL
jgi:hypothetical protein